MGQRPYSANCLQFFDSIIQSRYLPEQNVTACCWMPSLFTKQHLPPLSVCAAPRFTCWLSPHWRLCFWCCFSVLLGTRSGLRCVTVRFIAAGAYLKLVFNCSVSALWSHERPLCSWWAAALFVVSLLQLLNHRAEVEGGLVSLSMAGPGPPPSTGPALKQPHASDGERQE